MSIALVQSKTVVLAGSVPTLTLDSTPVAGNVLVACWGAADGAGAGYGAWTAQAGVTWQNPTEYADFDGRMAGGIACGTVGVGASAVVELDLGDGSPTDTTIIVAEFSGLRSSPFDDAEFADGDAQTPTSPSITNSFKNALLVAGFSWKSSASAAGTWTNSFSHIASVGNSSMRSVMGYRVVSAVGSYNTASGLSVGDGSENYAATIMSLLAPVPTGGSDSQMLLRSIGSFHKLKFSNGSHRSKL